MWTEITKNPLMFKQSPNYYMSLSRCVRIRLHVNTKPLNVSLSSSLRCCYWPVFAFLVNFRITINFHNAFLHKKKICLVFTHSGSWLPLIHTHCRGYWCMCNWRLSKPEWFLHLRSLGDISGAFFGRLHRLCVCAPTRACVLPCVGYVSAGVSHSTCAYECDHSWVSPSTVNSSYSQAGSNRPGPDIS